MNRGPSELDERIAREFLRWTPPPSMPNAKPPPFSKNWCTCHNLIEEIHRRRGTVKIDSIKGRCLISVLIQEPIGFAIGETIPLTLCLAIYDWLDKYHANSTTVKP